MYSELVLQSWTYERIKKDLGEPDAYIERPRVMSNKEYLDDLRLAPPLSFDLLHCRQLIPKTWNPSKTPCWLTLAWSWTL